MDSNSSHSFNVVYEDEFENIPSTSSSYQSMEEDVDNLKVMFHSSKNVYRFGEPIDIRFYAFNNAYIMEEGDRVGVAELKKSPFMSHKVSTALTDSSIDIISDDLIEENQITAKKMTFTIEKLPEEIRGGKYLQFCYLNNQAQVVGLSIPFKLTEHAPEATEEPSRESQESSVMDIEVDKSNSDEVHMERQEDDDFIVVRTHENFLKERVEHLTRSNNLIQSLVRSLQNELSIKFIENKDLLEEKEKLSAQLDSQKEQIGKLTFDNDERYTVLKKQYDALVTSCDQLKNELEECKNAIQLSSQMIREKDDTINSLNRDLKVEQTMVRSDPKNEIEIQTLKRSLQEKDAEMAAYKLKRDEEVKALEDSLRKGVDNLKNINFKYETLSEQFTRREAELITKYKKAQNIHATTLARLESAKIEFSNVNNRLFFYKNKVEYLESIRNIESRSSSVASTPILTPVPTPVLAPVNAQFLSSAPAPAQRQVPMETQITVRDEIDSQLDQLEREESARAVAASTAPVAQTLPKQLINIDPLPSAPPAYVSAGPSAPTSTAPASKRVSFSGDNQLVDLPCVFCNVNIKCQQHGDGSGQVKEMIEHLELVHQQKMCPICSTLFDMKLPVFRSYFNNHVQNHLNNITYPTLDR